MYFALGDMLAAWKLKNTGGITYISEWIERLLHVYIEGSEPQLLVSTFGENEKYTITILQ